MTKLDLYCTFSWKTSSRTLLHTQSTEDTKLVTPGDVVASLTTTGRVLYGFDTGRLPVKQPTRKKTRKKNLGGHGEKKTTTALTKYVDLHAKYAPVSRTPQYRPSIQVPNNALMQPSPRLCHTLPTAWVLPMNETWTKQSCQSWEMQLQKALDKLPQKQHQRTAAEWLAAL